ncbi:hypothetical protein F5Y03DRAFT_163188 [Xylaria venustula]|nr:hypothetical protein F5Y03DRAFT_163188 [Xylaria venustula]
MPFFEIIRKTLCRPLRAKGQSKVTCDSCLQVKSFETLCWYDENCYHHKKSCTCGELPCGHRYCIECVASIFELSFKSEALFPPGCCGSSFYSSLQGENSMVWDELARNTGGRQDGEHFKALYHSKTQEYSYRRRIYCAQCKEIVPVENVVGFGTCGDGNKTCITCGREVAADLSRSGTCLGTCHRDRRLMRMDFNESFVKRGFLPCFECHMHIPTSVIQGEARCKCGVVTCIRCLRAVSARRGEWDDTHSKCTVKDDRRNVMFTAEVISLDACVCRTCGRVLEREGIHRKGS